MGFIFLLAACKILAGQLDAELCSVLECWYSKASISCILQTFYYIAIVQQEER